MLLPACHRARCRIAAPKHYYLRLSLPVNRGRMVKLHKISAEIYAEWMEFR